MRARLTLSADHEHKIFIVRYIGGIDGGEINDSMIDQLARFERAWEYDSVIDMRRHDGMVLASDIEDLATRWAQLAQGRDRGRRTAVISEDPLVRARISVTQSLFPQRVMVHFENYEEGLEWLKASRGPEAVAV
jgi:hypothetical protein